MDEKDDTNNISSNNNQYSKNNNYYEKPLHGSQIYNSNNLGASNNSMGTQKIQISNKTFTFLQPNGNSCSFNLKNSGEIQLLYQNIQSQIKYIICVLIKDDTYFNSKLVEKTFEGIKNNINSLEKILIKPENILICAFFNETKNSSIFNEDDICALKDDIDYILVDKAFNIEGENIKVHCITKKNFLSDTEILKLYYTIIIKELRINNSILFSSIITAGVFPTSNSLLNLIKLSFNTRNVHSIVVPLLEDEENSNLIFKVKKYERFHYNLYNMNFYDMTASVPISSLFNTMAIDNKLSLELLNFYNNIEINESIDYHDYNLSLNLYSKNYKITYYNTQTMGFIKYSELEEDPICDYKITWVKRYSGYYGNFFLFFKTFLDCNAFNIGQKICLFFHIMGLMIEFVFPSFSTMVIYTIFYEAFNTYDVRPAAFCTLLYCFALICSGACSLISIHTQRMRLTNLFFFIFMEIYYLFILICSIVAMDNVKKNKKNDPYKFNTAAITCIIIFTFIPGILPILLKIKIVFENIVNMLLYLILGAPSSSSNFYIAKILNACDAPGGNNIKERKGIVIIIYFLTNLFFGSLTFFNYTRKKRVEAVMGFGILYLIYNFIKTIAITLSIINGDKKVYLPANIEEEIRNSFGQKKEDYNNSYNNNSNNQYQDDEKNNENNNQYQDDDKNNYNNNNESNNQEYPDKSEIDNNQNNNDNNNNYDDN